MFQFTTKADTLRALSSVLSTAQVLPQVCLTVGDAEKDPEQILSRLEEAGLLAQKLIVRSSAKNEDTAEKSNAGKFLSIQNVEGSNHVLSAVKQVSEAMGSDLENQIFIQPFLTKVEICGVAFTVDPNTGGNYYVLNYDSSTGSTSSVTDGTGTQLDKFYHFKAAPYKPHEPLDRVISLCRELEEIFQCPALDLEFAISKDILYLLQVRPLLLNKPLAEKLVEYCLSRLRTNPELHDKVEFEIAFTCYTFALPKRVKILGNYGFTPEEQDCLVYCLRELTNSIICKEGCS